MSSLAWFQDGVGYGAAQLADWQALVSTRGAFKHVLRSTAEFAATPNVAGRTVAVGAGYGLVGGVTSGGTWAWSSGETVAIPAASNDNPRKDLIVARLLTKAADGTDGLALTLVQGTAASAPTVPARPANSVALWVVDVPKASTTFTLTDVRTSGAYTDQAAFSNGLVAISWAGQLPSPAAFPVGFALYDYGTNQRWVRKNDGTWFTSDPGPWRLCTPQNVQASDGTNVTVTGSLYMREDSTKWELSGQLNFAPQKNLNTVAVPALMPTGISRPTQNTYGASGQTWSTGSGVARISIMAAGTIEFISDGSVSNAYVNEQFSKSPWNA